MKKTYKEFVKETSQIPLPTKEEESLLLKKVSEGDKDALESLVKANMRFVVRVAWLYKGKGVSLNDLIKEGRLGLIDAIKTFDSSKNIRFISYAVWIFRKNIIKAVNEKTGTERSLDFNPAALRTCFDPSSNEYKKTTMEDKIDILRLHLEKTEAINLYMEYVEYYVNINKKHVLSDLPLGLIYIVEHLLKTNR